MRDDVERRTNAETAQKTANAAASNAVKLEKARSMAIDQVIRALSQMPEKAGSHIRQTRSENGKQVTIDYNVSELVTALEKLQRMGGGDSNMAPVQVIIDV